MAWYYYNENNAKVGPYTVQQIKELVQRRVITRETRLENSEGRSALAETMQGLDFPPEQDFEPDFEPEIDPMFESQYEPESDQSNFSQSSYSYSSYSSYSPRTPDEPPAPKKVSAPKARAAYTRRPQASGSIFSSIVSWLLDFAFKDIRVHIVNRIVVCVIYVIACIVVILCGLGMTFSCLNEVSKGEGVINVLVIPFVWLGVPLAILFVRLYCEIFVILLDWVVETTKAARLYMDNYNKESGEN